jgi:hypothetical protein
VSHTADEISCRTFRQLRSAWGVHWALKPVLNINSVSNSSTMSSPPSSSPAMELAQQIDQPLSDHDAEIGLRGRVRRALSPTDGDSTGSSSATLGGMDVGSPTIDTPVREKIRKTAGDRERASPRSTSCRGVPGCRMLLSLRQLGALELVRPSARETVRIEVLARRPGCESAPAGEARGRGRAVRLGGTPRRPLSLSAAGLS